jgi:polysaccharide export outer membrane protein
VQTVGSDGKIKIPYAGEILVAGLSPSDISQTIEQKLKGKAIKPQVLVSIVSNGSSWASVSGDVTGAARVPLTPKGDRILDIISQAGGVKAMPFETYVRLTRGQSTETVLLDTILKKPAENVYIYPGDQIYVYRQPTSYVALGAVTAQKDYAIDEEKLSLSQAVARAGGMIDAQADPASAYLFRYESPAVVKAINPDSTFLSGNEPVPVIYRINFSKPENFFLAQEFLIRDKDIIYVADSSTVQFNKFLGILRNVASIYGSLRINSLILN